MKSCCVVALTLLAVVVGMPSTLRAADVAGKWQMVLQTDNGPREIPAEFKVAGETVTGTFDTAPVTGTWKDGVLSLAFSYTTAEGGMTAEATIKGRLEAEAITGQWTFAEYGGPFKATRRN